MDDFWGRYLKDVALPRAETHCARNGRGGRPADLRTHRFIHDDGREIVAAISEAEGLIGVSVSSLRQLRGGSVEKARGWRYGGVVEG